MIFFLKISTSFEARAKKTTKSIYYIYILKIHLLVTHQTIKGMQQIVKFVLYNHRWNSDGATNKVGDTKDRKVGNQKMGI